MSRGGGGGVVSLTWCCNVMNRLASPRAVDSASKLDKGECVCSRTA